MSVSDPETSTLFSVMNDHLKNVRYFKHLKELFEGCCCNDEHYIPDSRLTAVQ